MDQFPSDRARLGDYEVNLQTGELRPCGAEGTGQTVLLREQPFRILKLLIESDGKIVTREEIRNALWPNDTIVDFGHSINVAIGILRRMLGDSSESPQYIETVARRGYRLLASLEWLPGSAVPRGNDKPEDAPMSDLRGAARRVYSYKRLWLGATAFAVLATGAWTYVDFHRSPALSPGDTVVLTVKNDTTDPAFEDALYTAARVGLIQTPYVNLLDNTKVMSMLSEMKLSNTAKLLEPENAQRVCVKTNSKAAVNVEIAEEGNEFRIGLMAVDCHSGKTLAHVAKTAATRDKVIQTLGVALVQLRGKLGEPAASIARFNKPLETATSASPEALQLLTDGYRRHLAGDFAGAISFYQRAIEADPNLALAYSAQVSGHSSTGRYDLAAIASEKVFALRNQLTAPLRHQAEYYHDLVVTRDVEKACDATSQWVNDFPQDFQARDDNAFCLQTLGQPDRSLAQIREAARLIPSPVTYAEWVILSLNAGRYDETQAIFEQADKLGFDSEELREYRFDFAFQTRNEQETAKQWKWADGRPNAKSELTYEQAYIDQYLGKSRAAHKLAEQLHARPLSDWHIALTDALLGDASLAHQEAEAALKDRTQPCDPFAVILAFAFAGDTKRAQQLFDTLKREKTPGVDAREYSLAMMEAAIQLNQQAPADAVGVLQPTLKYDLSDTNSLGNMFPAYFRGLGYLGIHDGPRAAAEFQKVLDHPGLVDLHINGALARLQLARAQRMMGDKIAARSSYEAFLALWKDADADIPVYKQAKAEYAALMKQQ